MARVCAWEWTLRDLAEATAWLEIWQVARGRNILVHKYGHIRSVHKLMVVQKKPDWQRTHGSTSRRRWRYVGLFLAGRRAAASIKGGRRHWHSETSNKAGLGATELDSAMGTTPMATCFPPTLLRTDEYYEHPCCAKLRFAEKWLVEEKMPS
eukprot:6469087-Amphidinium_carterae.2